MDTKLPETELKPAKVYYDEIDKWIPCAFIRYSQDGEMAEILIFYFDAKRYFGDEIIKRMNIKSFQTIYAYVPKENVVIEVSE